MTTTTRIDGVAPKKKNGTSSKHKHLSVTSTKGLNRAARRKLQKETGVLVKRDDSHVQDQQGEKIYACLHPNCNETFEIWRDARNHMNNCKVVPDPHLLKPRIKDSRKRGNQLLEQGEATKKKYASMPTEAELVQKIRDFHSINHKETKKSYKGSLTDVRVIMRRVVKPEWGNSLTKFSTLGFGEWQEFLEANNLGFVEDADTGTVTE